MVINVHILEVRRFDRACESLILFIEASSEGYDESALQRRAAKAKASLRCSADLP